MSSYILSYFLLVTLFVIELAAGAKICMSGSGKSFSEKYCGISPNTNVDCHQFTCEGGRSPFVLRTCGNEIKTTTGCAAGIATCDRAGGNGYCYTCSTDNCNKDDNKGSPTGSGGGDNSNNNNNNNRGNTMPPFAPTPSDNFNSQTTKSPSIASRVWNWIKSEGR